MLEVICSICRVTGEARWLTDDEAAVWTPFVVSTMHVFSQLDDELKQGFDLSHLDYGVLSQLSFSEDRRMRMADLADRFGVGRSHMTYRVARLERKGLVLRCSVVEDQRGVAAVLTDEGEDLLRQAAPMHVETVRRLFIDQIDPGHFPALHQVFGQLVAIQDAQRGTG